MTVSHETWKASDSPAIQAAMQQQRRAEKLQPRRQPSAHEAPDHAAGGLTQHARLPVQRREPQLATSTSTKPATRTAVFMRETVTPCARRSSAQHGEPSISGNRNAGQPNRKNNTSASQAPTTPMRLWIVAALPV